MNIKNTLLFGIMSFMMLISIPNHVNAELKMGIVNLDLLFKEIPIYRESQSKIKKQFDPRARNLKTLEKEWTTLNEKYLKNEKVMSENEKTSLVEKIKGIEKKFRSGQEKIQKDLQKVQADELARIRGIVESAITKYAKDNDFDIIIRADGTTLFAKKYINITQEIISQLQ
jgi:outer membrane protein